MGRRRVLVLMDSISMPSSHASALQYRESFERAGYDVRVVSRDRPEGFAQHDRAANWAWRMRMPRRSTAMKADIRRRWDDRIVELAREYDVVYAVKIPSLALHERIVAAGPRLLVLFTDAFWLPWARERGWSDWERILSTGHGVLTVNEFTADRARRYNPRVFIMFDSPQTEDFDAARHSRGSRDPNAITLGWIGSPATATSLFRIVEPLETLFAQHPALHLRLVGTGGSSLLNIPRFEKVRWSAREGYDHDSMIEEVLAMDIGLFPMFSGDDSLARGALKAAIYMSGEAAVVAQRYGEVQEIIEDGVNGFLAGDDREWVEKITQLIERPDERRAIAARGLAMVRERFSRAATFEQLRHAIDSV